MADTASRPRRYFACQYRLLRILGLGWWHHPDEGDTRNFFGWYLYYCIITELVCVAGFVSLETIDPFIGEIDMERIMFSLAFVITHGLTMIKLYLFLFRNIEIQDIVRTIEIDLHRYYHNNVKTRATIKITRIITASFVAFGWVIIGTTSLYGAFQDLQWKASAQLNDTSLRMLPQQVYIPWDYQHDKSYIFTFALETIGLFWTAHIVMAVDTFITSLILHMSAQFVIFHEAILTAYDRTISLLYENICRNRNTSMENKLNLQNRAVQIYYTEEEIEKALEKTLKDCIGHHQVLISCVEKFATTYSYGFMSQLLSSMGAICVVMVQVAQDSSSLMSMRLVTSLAFFATMTMQLAMQCYASNKLTLEAGGVSLAVMQCRWERMPVRLRRLLLLVMMRAQRPLRLNAAGFAYMDNACFLATMKAAYSYYAVLSQK